MTKARFSFIDPGAIMSVVVSLIILAIGVFAFFIVIEEAGTAVGGYSNATTSAHDALNNTSKTGDSVFNIVGVVLIIGAIMSIVGLVYNYVK